MSSEFNLHASPSFDYRGVLSKHTTYESNNAFYDYQHKLLMDGEHIFNMLYDYPTLDATDGCVVEFKYRVNDTGKKKYLNVLPTTFKVISHG